MPSRPTRRRVLTLLGATVAAGSAVAVDAADTRGKKLNVSRVLFLGNSITLHGPAPDIGWTGNWGMAASREDLDYVHQLLSRMQKYSTIAPQSKVQNIAEFERHLEQYPLKEKLKAEWDFQADLVIVAIGENASSLDSDEAKERYTKAFAALLKEIRQHGSPTIIVRGCFWTDAAKDAAMKCVCEQTKTCWVEASDLGRDPANAARSERSIEHAGVAGHPGDRGMQRIADRLWDEIEKQPQLWN